MITPSEIKNKTFKAVGLGYDKNEVNNFLEDIVSYYEEIYREKVSLEEQIATLQSELIHYKNIEKTMQKALILAEKTAEDTKNAALENARNIENDAIVRSDAIISSARNRLEEINNRIVKTLQLYETYKINFQNLLNSQFEILNSDAFNMTQNQEVRDFLDDNRRYYTAMKESSSMPSSEPEANLNDAFEFIEGETH